MLGAVVSALAASSAFMAGSAPVGVSQRSDVVMQFGKGFKAGSNTPASLKGYTVGSRAPPGAVASGTTAKFGFGIDNLYGGKKSFKPTPVSSAVGGSSWPFPSAEAPFDTDLLSKAVSAAGVAVVAAGAVA